MMRTLRVLLGSALSFLLFASAELSSAPNPARKTTNACTAIQVTSPDSPAQSRRKVKTKPLFSASSILDLKLQTALSPAATGQHALEFKLYTPKGHLYQTLSATLASPTATTDRRKRGNQALTATATFPVAGTTIVTNSLYGDWRVEAFLDGERSVACARPLSFVIEP